jgi:hypothetical protein
MIEKDWEDFVSFHEEKVRESEGKITDRLHIENEKKKIRELIAKGYSNQDIRNTLGLPQSTYERRLSDIRMGDLKAIADADEGVKASIVVNALDKLHILYSKMEEVINDPEYENKDKIKAVGIARELIIDSCKLFLSASEQMKTATKYLSRTKN